MLWITEKLKNPQWGRKGHWNTQKLVQFVVHWGNCWHSRVSWPRTSIRSPSSSVWQTPDHADGREWRILTYTGQEPATMDSRKKSLVSTSLPFRTYTYPESRNGQETSLQVHHTLNTTCSTFSLLVAGKQFLPTVCHSDKHLKQSYSVSNVTPKHSLASIIDSVFTGLNAPFLACTCHHALSLLIYSGYGKYSDHFKFFTLCFIAAIC